MNSLWFHKEDYDESETDSYISEDEVAELQAEESPAQTPGLKLRSGREISIHF